MGAARDLYCILRAEKLDDPNIAPYFDDTRASQALLETLPRGNLLAPGRAPQRFCLGRGRNRQHRSASRRQKRNFASACRRIFQRARGRLALNSIVALWPTWFRST